MQNVILLAVVCVGFFYALYRVYKNSDGTEGSSGCGGNCMHCPDGRRLRFPEGRTVTDHRKDSTARTDGTVLFCGDGRFSQFWSVISSRNMIE